MASLNAYLGSNSSTVINFGQTIITLKTDLKEYEKIEFEFTTPGIDATVSTGIVHSKNFRFAVIAIGAKDGLKENRCPYSVVFDYNESTRELQLGHCIEKPELHLLGIYGYKKI